MALISDDCKNPVLKPTYPIDSDLATRELIDKFVQAAQSASSVKDMFKIAKLQRQIYRKGYLIEIVYLFGTRWMFWLYLHAFNKPEKPVQVLKFDVEEGQS